MNQTAQSKQTTQQQATKAPLLLTSLYYYYYHRWGGVSSERLNKRLKYVYLENQWAKKRTQYLK
jgi:hypothetical protein